jgi:hypothetical protein
MRRAGLDSLLSIFSTRRRLWLNGKASQLTTLSTLNTLSLADVRAQMPRLEHVSVSTWGIGGRSTRLGRFAIHSHRDRRRASTAAVSRISAGRTAANALASEHAAGRS